MPSVSPSIDNLEETWASLDALLASLSEEEWKRPTGCPGWTVQDNVSHLVDYESRLLGRPAPERPDNATTATAEHIKNDMGRGNEIGVDPRRSRTGEQVLDEFRDVTAERIATLARLTTEELDAETQT